MQKRTTLRPQSHRNVTRASENSGLSAKAKKPTQSARTKSALDTRSHRTGLPLSVKNLGSGARMWYGEKRYGFAAGIGVGVVILNVNACSTI
jgi:hypothetical protein